jgi:hypothetical protein
VLDEFEGLDGSDGSEGLEESGASDLSDSSDESDDFDKLMGIESKGVSVADSGIFSIGLSR